MATTRVAWQERYATVLSSLLTSDASFFPTTDIGIEGTGSGAAKFVMPLTEHPHLNPGASTLETEMATGQAERHQLEYTNVAAEPASVTLTMPANQYTLSYFLGLLFQGGVTEGSSDPVILTCDPYTTPDVDKYCCIVRQLTDDAAFLVNDDKSHILNGCICTSLTISGEEGGLVMLTAEMMGAEWTNDTITSIPTMTWDGMSMADTGAFYKFQDISMKINPNQQGEQDFDTPNFSITISNNAVGNYYNNDTIQKYVLGRLTGEGTFRIPWGAHATVGGNVPLSDFTSGNRALLTLYKDDAAPDADGEFMIQLNIQYTDVGFGGEVEVGSDITFSMVTDSTNTAIKAVVAYDQSVADRGW